MPPDGTGYAPYIEQSATLLSQQPITEQKPKRDLKGWDRVYSHLESRINSLKTWRWSWWAHWSILAAYFLPRRYHWVITSNRTWRGSPINDAIIDGTGTLAVQTCAAGLWTGLTSPSRPWFKLGSLLAWETIDADGQEWFEDTEKKVYAVLAQSNFYDIAAQMFQDVVVFGSSPVICYEDFEDVVRFYLPCAGEYFLGVGSRLDVDTHYREYTMTILQIVEMFKIENCPAEVVKMYQAGGASLDTELIVAHAIEPNIPIGGGSAKDPVRLVPDQFAFREIYWLRGNKSTQPLSRRGFHGKPFMVARWSTVSNDAYGRSPCMDALGDTKQLQLETKRKAEFIEKMVRPPMGASPAMKNEPASILPAQITFVTAAEGTKGFWPLFEVNPAGLAPMVQDIAQVSERIKETLFVTLFMAISQMEGVQPRNELELTKRDLERLQALGPFINKFETEFAAPMLQRVLDVMMRRNMLMPLPQSLQKVPMKMSFVSIMTLAQRASTAVAMKDVFTTAGELASAAQAAGLPNPVRIINLEKALREYGEVSNFPLDLFYTDDQVQENDKAHAAAQQQAQGPQSLMAAVQAAHTLSQTSTGPGNALSALTGAAGAGV
jgi:hypothetical protein